MESLQEIYDETTNEYQELINYFGLTKTMVAATDQKMLFSIVRDFVHDVCKEAPKAKTPKKAAVVSSPVPGKGGLKPT